MNAKIDRSTAWMAGIIGAICLIVSVVSFTCSVGKIFTLDETDLAARAHMINQEGPRGPESFFGANSGEAYPHPPLCEFTVALLFKLFGETEVAARSFGILCYLTVGLMMVLIIGKFLSDCKPAVRDTAIFAFICLYLVNPLILQHSMLVDGDGFHTFLFVNLFCCLFIYLERPVDRRFILSRLLLASVLALAYLSKEGTPFLLVGGMILYRVLNRQWRQLWAEVLLVWLLAMAMAWAAWFIFCKITGVNLMIFLKQQYGFRVSRLIRSHFLIQAIKNIHVIFRWPLYWVSAPFFFLLAYCLMKRVGLFLKSGRAGLLDFCFLTAMAIWVPYLLVRPSIDMMKYQHPVYPLLLAAMMSYSATFFKNVSAEPLRLKRKIWLFLMGLGICTVLMFYYYGLGDYLFYLQDTGRSWRWLAFFENYHGATIWFMAIGVFYAFAKKKELARYFCATCVLLILPINVALDLHQVQPYTTAESWLNYGETGLAQTLDFLSPQLHAQTTTGFRKDFLYYLRLRKKIEFTNIVDPNYFFWPENLKPIVMERNRSRLPELLVFDPVSLFNNRVPTSIIDLILREYTVEKRIGNFTVLKLRPRP